MNHSVRITKPANAPEQKRIWVVSQLVKPVTVAGFTKLLAERFLSGEFRGYVFDFQKQGYCCNAIAASEFQELSEVRICILQKLQ